ncbi:hypothetical protein KFL_003920040 [Klebsormidium nitens]|uniref:VTT domain-containing protein n=1 Tax=Klebsormidium nitens TaxID=105231 RepID=A0A1Y1IAJ9_KLENI|nr:hypothetical protein KFL_003920040 [Klebsormidium nitens]|eukprot:GAQ87985.1 hypothetical protein KFL_003920040 [Klebsormidium nitens]
MNHMALPLRLPLLAAFLSLAPVVCFPATFLLELYAGATLPFLGALLLVLLAKFFAAAAAYAVARSPLQPVVHACLANYRRYEVLQLGAARGGWKFMLLARLSPIPNFIVNYALWQVPVKDFLWPTAGAFPVVLQTVYLGHLLPSLATLPAATTPAVGRYCLLWLSLLICTLVLRKVRRACYTWSGLEVLPDTFGKSAIQLLLDEERGQPRGQLQGRGEEDGLLEAQSIQMERMQPG